MGFARRSGVRIHHHVEMRRLECRAQILERRSLHERLDLSLVKHEIAVRQRQAQGFPLPCLLAIHSLVDELGELELLLAFP
jgi:hypothetical protein